MPHLAMLGDAADPAKDGLNFRRYAEPLVNIVTAPHTETPLTIGIFGKWGTGKTTLLRVIENGIEKEDNPAIWFNPWLYKNDDNLIIPLLQTIHDTLKESESKGAKFAKAAERVATIVSRVSASVLLKTVTLGEVSLSNIDDEYKRYAEGQKKAVSTIRSLRNDLAEAVKELTNDGNGGRLILFIDDLDRCAPQKIIGLLEAIKLFLDLKHTVIFLALDRDIVQQGIQVFYKDFELTEEAYGPTTADYLDKIIQIPLYLYPLGFAQINEYLDYLNLPPNIETQKDLLLNCLAPNPRKIKRVLNIYNLTTEIVARSPSQIKDNIRLPLLAKLIIIQQQWYMLYQDIIAKPTLLNLVEKVYLGELDINSDAPWLGLGDDWKEIKSLCRKHYLPQSRLATLFTYGEDRFHQSDVTEYLFLLS